MKKIATIIIVNHNHKKSIVKLIDSIYNHNDLETTKIIFIQNKPSNFIKNYTKDFEEIVFVGKEVYKVFRNVNDAIHIAKSMFNVNYFLLLNPDIVLKNNILTPLLK